MFYVKNIPSFLIYFYYISSSSAKSLHCRKLFDDFIKLGWSYVERVMSDYLEKNSRRIFTSVFAFAVSFKANKRFVLLLCSSFFCKWYSIDENTKRGLKSVW